MKKKENLSISGLCRPSRTQRKISKNDEKNERYMTLARELKKLWNMKVMVISIVIGALGTILKGLVKGLEDLEINGQVETIQSTALLRSARILRRVLETCSQFKLHLLTSV